jgi:HD-GYP domain-containing protein (c-di-GMP phosphodiesterase class II)
MIGLTRQARALDIALTERDDYTGEHCSRVESFSLQLGKRCGLGIQDLHLLGVAAKLHDVGKVGIPDHILLKPGRLDDDEWEIMKSHSEVGQRVCGALPHPSAEAVGRIVRHHHERFQGGGYPDGLSGEQIPIAARIIALIDAYDAMTTTRPYHQPRTHDQVMRVLDDEGEGHFDPFVRQHFDRLIERQLGL